jgi:hypothetical protein
MVNGINMGPFMTNRPGPVQRDTSDPFANLPQIGSTLQRWSAQDDQQALQEQQLAQQHEHDQVNQGQQARQMLMQDKRAGQREDLYRTQENRRENAAQFERSKLKDAEHEALLRSFYAATTSNDPRAIQYSIDALHRAGYNVEQMEHAPPPAPPGASFDPTLGDTLQADDSQPMAPLPGQSSALPTKKSSKVDAGTSAQLDAAEADILPKLSGKKAGGKQSKRDAKLSAELDAAEADIIPKLTGNGAAKKKKYLPGQDVILGSGDSYNKL